MTDTEYVPEVWTYTGRCELVGGKLGYGYILPNGKEVGFAKLMTGGVVGGRYEVYVRRDTDTTTARKGLYKYLGIVDNMERVKTWAANSKALETFYATRVLEKKEGNNLLYNLTLNDLGVRYALSSRPQRRALLATVIEAITSFRE